MSASSSDATEIYLSWFDAEQHQEGKRQLGARWLHRPFFLLAPEGRNGIAWDVSPRYSTGALSLLPSPEGAAWKVTAFLPFQGTRTPPHERPHLSGGRR